MCQIEGGNTLPNFVRFSNDSHQRAENALKKEKFSILFEVVAYTLNIFVLLKLITTVA